MPPRIELWQLRYFVAVAEELSFRRAAERLSITQPPLTRQMQALEEEVGERLFERSSRGVLLTASGEHLFDEARKLLASADHLFSRLGRRADQQDTLRLGITTVVDASLFTWLESAVKDGLPGLRLVQKRQISQRSIADVRRRVLDLALIGLPSATTDLTVELLVLDPLVAAIPHQHHLAKRRSIHLLELRDDPLFWFARPLNPAYFDHFEAIFRSIGFDPQRLAEPSDHHVLLGLIADGQGVALVPKSLTSIARTGVLYKTLKDPDELTLGIAVAYVADGLSEPAKWLLHKLRDHFRSAPLT